MMLRDYVGWTSEPSGGSGGMPPRKKNEYILELNQSIWWTFIAIYEARS